MRPPRGDCSSHAGRLPVAEKRDVPLRCRHGAARGESGGVVLRKAVGAYGLAAAAVAFVTSTWRRMAAAAGWIGCVAGGCGDLRSGGRGDLDQARATVLGAARGRRHNAAVGAVVSEARSRKAPFAAHFRG